MKRFRRDEWESEKKDRDKENSVRFATGAIHGGVVDWKGLSKCQYSPRNASKTCEMMPRLDHQQQMLQKRVKELLPALQWKFRDVSVRTTKKESREKKQAIHSSRGGCPTPSNAFFSASRRPVNAASSDSTDLISAWCFEPNLAAAATMAPRSKRSTLGSADPNIVATRDEVVRPNAKETAPAESFANAACVAMW